MDSPRYSVPTMSKSTEPSVRSNGFLLPEAAGTRASPRALLAWLTCGIDAAAKSSATPSPTPSAVSSVRIQPSRPPVKANLAPSASSRTRRLTGHRPGRG